MAANPLVPQGTLNRLRGSVVIPSFTSLNVTAPFLGKEAISISFEGNVTDYIDTLTGAITSPVPYMKASVKAHLLKTQNIANLYKRQLELSALIGEVTVYSDSSTFDTYTFHNCSIMGQEVGNFGGEDGSYMITLGGLYYINTGLWGSN